MWGKKARRIISLTNQLTAARETNGELHGLLIEFREAHDILSERCRRLAEDLRAAQNALLVEADQNGIRAEAIAHVREVIAIAGMGLCADCDPDVDVHHDHTPESGCPVEGCVCRIRDNDPPGGAE